MLLATVLSAWLQYAADGRPHARAIVTGACPVVNADTRAIGMTVRTPQGGAFADIVCEAPVPADAKRVRVGDRVIAAPARRTQRIAVLGDTGCRIASYAAQACDKPGAWPFARISAAVAAAKPDLVVHVGDYYYREVACPAGTDCTGSPHGDNAASWRADFFAPAAPMFAAAPLVLARGNHENCERGGVGWFRYLDARAATACNEATAPFAVDIAGVRLVLFDSAVAEDRVVTAARTETFKQQFRDVAAMGAARTPPWFVTHRPPYLNDDQHAAMGNALAPYGLVLAGHLHLFAVLNVEGFPPQVVQGVGGTKLDPDYVRFLGLQAAPLKLVGQPFGSAMFGFTLYERAAEGWTLTLRDPDGRVKATCAIVRKVATCR